MQTNKDVHFGVKLVDSFNERRKYMDTGMDRKAAAELSETKEIILTYLNIVGGEGTSALADV